MSDSHAGSAASMDADLLELDNQLCFALHSTAREIVKAYRPALSQLELTHPQYLVLLVLWGWARDREARPTVKALGGRLALDSGTLTPLLKRLETRGLITRTRSRADERELFVHLTPAGVALKKRARRVPASLMQQSPLPLAELVKLREQLKRLRSALVNERMP
jgi:DNA-binding MarR family transcriptional regulator